MSEEIIRKGRCSNISCLNAATYVLKIEKGLVRNFLAQEKRLRVKLKLMGESYWAFYHHHIRFKSPFRC